MSNSPITPYKQPDIDRCDGSQRRFVVIPSDGSLQRDAFTGAHSPQSYYTSALERTSGGQGCLQLASTNVFYSPPLLLYLASFAFSVLLKLVLAVVPTGTTTRVFRWVTGNVPE
ncbi:hypothetical protein OUZ56_011790 [Daphnia magna]|uniref:Uncharacterized protein n=1 Tax=Daphnia magna TaxID=35525 RepID=A0ABQ9Z152_9CRUS|nr:hypothetical protein OUZ56_011790 [Daphnia magna]